MNIGRPQGLRFFYNPKMQIHQSLFDELFKLLQELLMITGGDLNESVSWMNEIDKQYKITNAEYGIGDFLQELEEKAFLKRNDPDAPLTPSSKMDSSIRQSAFNFLFGKIRKTKSGKHNTNKVGNGAERVSDLRPFQFGDQFSGIESTDSIRNAFINHGIDQFRLEEDDLVVRESLNQSNCSTVLMIDISHSMILYGEDRITPAKKVALALSQLILQEYPKDSLDIIVFGDDAWEVELKDLPYLQVGPYHTNTIAGLELAIKILQKRKNPNKNIMMITDGKPSCMKRGKEYYKNSVGLDRQIVNRTLSVGSKCHKLGIDVTTFMVTDDPYLVQFIDQFSKISHGKAFYTNLNGLGEEVFINYEKNRKKSKK